jgi:hypothetical protein
VRDDSEHDRVEDEREHNRDRHSECSSSTRTLRSSCPKGRARSRSRPPPTST